MKIAVFTNLDPKLKSGNSFLDALRSRPDVTEVEKLSMKDFKIEVVNNEMRLYFNGKVFDETYYDLYIVRTWGNKNVTLLVSILKLIKEKGGKVFDNNLIENQFYINKKVDCIKLVKNGILVPDTYSFSSFAQIKDSNLRFPCIMKSYEASMGRDVFKVDSLEDAIQNLKENNMQHTDVIFQEFIDYKLDLRVVIIGDEVAGAMRRIPSQGDFRANFSLGGSVESFDISEEMKEIAVKAARACNLDIAGVDLLIDNEDKIYVLEANHNPGYKGINQILDGDISRKAAEFIIDKTI